IRDFHVTGVQTCALPISTMKRQTLQRATGLAVVALAFGLGVTACAPPGADTSGAAAQKDQRQEIELQPDETAEGFDLDALVEARSEERRVGKGGSRATEA